MAYNYPVYRAPSVPKLNKTNISSPLRGNVGRTGLQINKSKFSFTSPSSDPQNLSSEVQERTNLGFDSIKNIAESLTETNRILVEIQNQLSIDFATRIAEDRKQIGQLKKQKSKKDFASKEAALESIRNIGSGLSKQVDKVLTPAKSLFQRIIDFFKSILTGIIVNNLLLWLSKDENKKKLKDFFGFLVDHWEWIVGLFVAGKLLGGLLSLIGVVRRVRGAIDLLRGKGKLPGGGGGKGGPLDCSAILKCLKGAPEFANVLSYYMKSNPKVYGTIEQIAKGTALAPIPLVGPAGVPLNIPQRPAPQTQRQQPQTNLTSQQIWDLVRANATDPAILGIIATAGLASMLDSPAPGPADFASLSVAIPSLLARFKALQLAGKLRGASGVALSKGGIVPSVSSPIIPIQPQKKKCNACALGFSQGGTVGGSGSGTVDSVPAMLAPGEYVIRTAASKLFRPLLSDINENAGRLWNYFREAVLKLTDVSSKQIENSERFSTILEDLNNTFKQKKQKESITRIGDLTGGGKGGGFGGIGKSVFEKTGEVIGTQQGKSTGIPGGGWLGGQVGRQKGGQVYDDIMKKIPNLNINPTIQNNINLTPFSVDLPPPPQQRIPELSRSSKSSSTIIPINLPTKRAKIPQINLPQGDATFVPEISSVNMANPYMKLTPSIYGIFV